jgi:hypothetical protein
MRRRRGKTCDDEADEWKLHSQLPLHADAAIGITDAHTDRYGTFCIYHSAETDLKGLAQPFASQQGRPSLSLLLLEGAQRRVNEARG